MNHFPEIIHFDVTGKCNFNCLHCRGMVSKKELSTKEIICIIKKVLKELGKNLKWVELGGGEPLLRKDLEKIIKVIKKNSKSKVLVVSNGTLFTEKRAKSLLNSGLDRILFSLESHKREINDLIRQKGSYNAVIRATEVCRKNKLKFVLRLSISKYNMNSIEDYISFCKSLGTDEIGISGCVFVGNSLNNINKTYINKKDYWGILKKIPYFEKKYKIDIFSGDPLAIIANKPLLKKIKEKYGTYEIYSGCNIGICYMYINNEGCIAICPMLNDKVISKINGVNLRKVWNNNEFFNKMRKRNFSGKCGLCKFKFLCGGCRAQAYWRYKNVYASDPICPI